MKLLQNDRNRPYFKALLVEPLHWWHCCCCRKFMLINVLIMKTAIVKLLVVKTYRSNQGIDIAQKLQVKMSTE